MGQNCKASDWNITIFHPIQRYDVISNLNDVIENVGLLTSFNRIEEWTDLNISLEYIHGFTSSLDLEQSETSIMNNSFLVNVVLTCVVENALIWVAFP